MFVVLKPKNKAQAAEEISDATAGNKYLFFNKRSLKKYNVFPILLSPIELFKLIIIEPSILQNLNFKSRIGYCYLVDYIICEIAIKVKD